MYKYDLSKIYNYKIINNKKKLHVKEPKYILFQLTRKHNLFA